jgi:hypothetical protein
MDCKRSHCVARDHPMADRLISIATGLAKHRLPVDCSADQLEDITVG